MRLLSNQKKPLFSSALRAVSNGAGSPASLEGVVHIIDCFEVFGQFLPSSHSLPSFPGHNRAIGVLHA